MWWSVKLSPTFYHKGGSKTMTNEELALQIRAGERGRITELWARGQVIMARVVPHAPLSVQPLQPIQASAQAQAA